MSVSTAATSWHSPFTGKAGRSCRLDGKSEGLSLLDEVMVTKVAARWCPSWPAPCIAASSALPHKYVRSRPRAGVDNGTPDLVRRRSGCRRVPVAMLIPPSETPPTCTARGRTPSLKRSAPAIGWRAPLVGGRRLGAALYQVAELHRLRGDFSRADEAYRLGEPRGSHSSTRSWLLRLNQGQVKAADTSIGLALQARAGNGLRGTVLPSCGRRARRARGGAHGCAGRFRRTRAMGRCESMRRWSRCRVVAGTRCGEPSEARGGRRWKRSVVQRWHGRVSMRHYERARVPAHCLMGLAFTGK